MPSSNAASDSACYAGVDVGGTNIKIGLVDATGRSLASTSIPTEQERGSDDAMRRAAETVRELCGKIDLDPAQLAGVGLATPGPLDQKRGMVLAPGNLPAWRNEPVRDQLSAAIGHPVAYANDANAAAFGEFWAGAGKQYESLVMITLGTGVGGGVILDGKLVGGAHDVGGEIGHIIINSEDDASLNSLGLRGTLEGYCGSYGVVGRAEAALADHYAESSLRDSVTGGEELTPLLVANAAEAGDELAMKVVLDTAKLLAIGIVTCVHLIDPEAVVIGGALTFGGAGHPLGERFAAEVRDQAKKRMIPSAAEGVVIDFAQLGGSAGYLGAAGLACQAAG